MRPETSNGFPRSYVELGTQNPRSALKPNILFLIPLFTCLSDCCIWSYLLRVDHCLIFQWQGPHSLTKLIGKGRCGMDVKRKHKVSHLLSQSYWPEAQDRLNLQFLVATVELSLSEFCFSLDTISVNFMLSTTLSDGYFHAFRFTDDTEDQRG